ncbi:hypothetical protein CU048_08190 [Beijerinckiaceae bacterium]|nr:hypothetical protein CU048_08190 [Beijerinckiaceae bacterium]
MTMLTAKITAGVSAVTALIAVVITYFLTRRREHEADWRKIKLEQYQNFMFALSSNVEGRANPDAMRQYTDTVNTMSLIAPMPVLRALRDFQDEISCKNPQRTEEAHDRLLNTLVRELRADIQPSDPKDDPGFKFRLLGLPTETLQRAHHQQDLEGPE